MCGLQSLVTTVDRMVWWIVSHLNQGFQTFMFSFLFYACMYACMHFSQLFKSKSQKRWPCSPKYLNISFLEQEILFKNYNTTINIWKLTLQSYYLTSCHHSRSWPLWQNKTTTKKKPRQYIRVVIFFLYAHIICNQVRSFPRFLKNYVYVCVCLSLRMHMHTCVGVFWGWMVSDALKLSHRLLWTIWCGCWGQIRIFCSGPKGCFLTSESSLQPLKSEFWGIFMASAYF